jgi:hypothetical protein
MPVLVKQGTGRKVCRHGNNEAFTHPELQYLIGFKKGVYTRLIDEGERTARSSSDPGQRWGISSSSAKLGLGSDHGCLPAIG